MGRTNVVASGGLSGLRIYAQLVEPNKKEGLWIKTENPEIEKYNYEKIKIISKKNTYMKMMDIPQTISIGSAVSIGKDIYIFSGSLNIKSVYKYNTLINKYTQLADIPYDFIYGGKATVVGTDIYLFGGPNSLKYAYK